MNKKAAALRVLFLAMAMSISSLFRAQNFEFDAADYDFNPEALTVGLMDSTGYSSCLHWVHNYNEIGSRFGQNAKFRLTHILRQINDTRAVEEFNKFYIPLYGSQQPVNVKIRVIKNGKELFVGSSKDIKEFEETNARVKAIALEQVSEGCLIESILAVEVNYNLSGEEYLQFGYPCKESIFCLIAPKTFIFKSKLYGSEVALRDTISDDQNYSYIKMKNVPAAYNEKYAQVDASKIRFEYKLDEVEGYNYKGQQWADMGRGIYEAINVDADKQKSSVKKFLKLCAADKLTSPEDKIFVVENYLKTNVDLNEGMPSVKNLSEIFENKAACSTDLLRIMALSYDELGVNYELAATCKRDDKNFDKNFHSWGYIQEVLFYFPDQKQYLDPYSNDLRYPNIDNLFLGQDAIRVKAEELGGTKSPITTIKLIQPNDIEKNIIKERFNVSFDPGMTENTIKWAKEYTGLADQNMRAICYFSEPEARDKTLEQIIAGAESSNKVENISVENFDITKAEQYHAPLKISADVKGSEFLEFAGDKIIFKVGEVIGQQSELYSEKPRQCTMDVGFLHYYDREIRVEIPGNYDVSGLDALKINKVFKDDQGKELFAFESSYTVEGNVIVIKIRESYDRLTYPISLYDNFSQVVNAAADFNKVSLLFKKK
jgi:hypothetical protein